MGGCWKGHGHPEKGRPNGKGSEGCTEQVILELSLEGQKVFTKFWGHFKQRNGYRDAKIRVGPGEESEMEIKV